MVSRAFFCFFGFWFLVFFLCGFFFFFFFFSFSFASCLIGESREREDDDVDFIGYRGGEGGKEPW